MSKPVFADPVLDGAADPVVIRHHESGVWWLFYTNRRANMDDPGGGWIQGSPIGYATSPDGVEWAYGGVVEGLDPPEHPGLNTHWAPEIIRGLGEYHMYLSYTVGAPDHFDVDRHIVHYTSPDLLAWTRRGQLPLHSDKVIDACVARCPDGVYRLWYKDEKGGSATWSARSDNLHDWTVEGLVIPGRPDGLPHEGPNVFALGGRIWLVVDEWHGMGVFHSSDARSWTRQGVILADPGSDPEDRCYARHGDVVVQDGWAEMFYFTHPGWDEQAKPRPETPGERRTVIHVARLTVADGVLVAERDVAPRPLVDFAQM